MDFLPLPYGQYKSLREGAWELLLTHQVRALPVSIMRIARNLGIEVSTYTEAAEILECCGLTEHATINDAISLYTQKWHILYSPDIKPVENTRFILARELSRILLGQQLEQKQILCFNIFYSNELLSPENEEQAAAFAVRVLAPSCVLWALDMTDASEIEKLCGLPHEISQTRANRLIELKEKNRFLTHPLERRLFEQFGQFIQEAQK